MTTVSALYLPIKEHENDVNALPQELSPSLTVLPFLLLAMPVHEAALESPLHEFLPICTEALPSILHALCPMQEPAPTSMNGLGSSANLHESAPVHDFLKTVASPAH